MLNKDNPLEEICEWCQTAYPLDSVSFVCSAYGKWHCGCYMYEDIDMNNPPHDYGDD
jgi:hypothetical protein